MKSITDLKVIARREKRKKMLLWQGDLLKQFKPVILVRYNGPGKRH